MEGEKIAELKAFLKRKGLKYKDLAVFLVVSEQDVKNYMRNKPEWPDEYISALSQTYNWHFGVSDSMVNDQHIEYRKAKAGHSVVSNHRVHLRGLLSPIVDDLPEAVYDRI